MASAIVVSRIRLKADGRRRFAPQEAYDTTVRSGPRGARVAVQLHRGPLLVNPYDIEAVADEIKRACEMDIAERRTRMRRLRRSIREYDSFWWVDSFMHAAFTRDLSSFPLSPDAVADQQQDYLPV